MVDILLCVLDYVLCFELGRSELTALETVGRYFLSRYDSKDSTTNSESKVTFLECQDLEFECGLAHYLGSLNGLSRPGPVRINNFSSVQILQKL